MADPDGLSLRRNRLRVKRGIEYDGWVLQVTARPPNGFAQRYLIVVQIEHVFLGRDGQRGNLAPGGRFRLEFERSTIDRITVDPRGSVEIERNGFGRVSVSISIGFIRR